MSDSLIRFGNYILLDRVAVGGMAEIWRAKTIGNVQGFERTVALKCILTPYTENEEFKKMFIEEAKIASSLNHSNIVRITNFGSFENKYFHEMEYVDGKSLRQIVKKARELGVEIPVDCSSYIISEVCKGLNYAHMKYDNVTNQHLKIIHRDISPQNIMISYEGEVKIIDWGIAKAVSNVDQTKAGVLKGKFGYMSPEQTAGIPLDLRSDIFSTGIVFYEILTGKRLFLADNEIATLKKVQDCDILSPSELNSKLDAQIESVVMKGLVRDRENRYQSCQEFYESIIRYMNKNYPSFSIIRLSNFVKDLFKAEINEDRVKIRNYESSIKSMSYNTEENIDLDSQKTRLSQLSQASYNSFDKNSIGNFTKASFSSDSYSVDATRVAGEKNNNISTNNSNTEVQTGQSSFENDFLNGDSSNQTTVNASNNDNNLENKSFNSSDTGNLLNNDFKTKKKSRSYRFILYLILLIVLAYYVNENYDIAKMLSSFNRSNVSDVIDISDSNLLERSQGEEKLKTIEQNARLYLNTNPESAKVKIDGELLGYTPINIDFLELNKKYRLELELVGYEKFERNIILRKKESRSTITLEKIKNVVSKDYSLLSINVDMPSYIYIDGKLVSKLTSVKDYKLKPGKHTIRFINKRSKLDYSTTIELKAGEVVRKKYNLR